MASTYTQNLNLEKPDGDDDISVLAINGNSEKLDAFAGNVLHTNQGTPASLDALSAILDNILVSLQSNGVKSFQVNFSSDIRPFTAATYLCTLYKSGTNTTYSCAIFRRVDAPYVYSASRNPSGWRYEQLSGIPMIRPSITGAASGITQNGYYIVDPSSRMVRVYCSARASRDILSTEVLGNIPSPYRPIVTSNLVGFFVGSANQVITFFGTIATNGNIYQAAGNTMREVLLIGEYQY